MAEIKRYCMSMEDHYGENAFEVCRPNIMGNPFTHLPKSKTKFKNLIKVKTRDEAVDLYEPYFDSMLRTNEAFRKEFDRMFEAYLNYETVYIGCFCQKGEKCHGDIIAKKLKQRAIKYMLQKLNVKKDNITSNS